MDEASNGVPAKRLRAATSTAPMRPANSRPPERPPGKLGTRDVGPPLRSPPAPSRAKCPRGHLGVLHLFRPAVIGRPSAGFLPARDLGHNGQAVRTMRKMQHILGPPLRRWGGFRTFHKTCRRGAKPRTRCLQPVVWCQPFGTHSQETSTGAGEGASVGVVGVPSCDAAPAVGSAVS